MNLNEKKFDIKYEIISPLSLVLTLVLFVCSFPSTAYALDTLPHTGGGGGSENYWVTMGLPIISAIIVVVIVAIIIVNYRQKHHREPPIVVSSPSGMANFCSNCGSPLDAGSKFCKNCGQKA